MKKFSTINESTRINNKLVEQELNNIENIEWDIHYDFYYKPDPKTKNVNSSDSFFQDIEKIKSECKTTQLIKITPKITSEKVNIEEWDNVLEFNSSAFQQVKDIKILRNIHNQIFDFLEKFEENDPRIIFKENTIIILLIGENVNEDDIELGSRLKEAKIKLYEKLQEFEGKYFSKVSYNSQLNRLYFEVKKFANQLTTYKLESQIIKTLQPQIKTKYYDEYEELEDLRDAVSEINDMGFYIKVSEMRKSWDDKIEIKLVEF